MINIPVTNNLKCREIFTWNSSSSPKTFWRVVAVSLWIVLTKSNRSDLRADHMFLSSVFLSADRLTRWLYEIWDRLPVPSIGMRYVVLYSIGVRLWLTGIYIGISIGIGKTSTDTSAECMVCMILTGTLNSTNLLICCRLTHASVRERFQRRAPTMSVQIKKETMFEDYS